jgi:hypothetical protein
MAKAAKTASTNVKRRLRQPDDSRVLAAQSQAIRLDLSLLKGRRRRPPRVPASSESAMSIDLVDELLDMLDGRRDSLAGIGALASIPRKSARGSIATERAVAAGE